MDSVAPTPFKAKRSPLRDLPGFDAPITIQADPAHSYAIQGWGNSFVASAIVLLSEVFRVFCGGSITKRLNDAFAKFKSWTRENQKGTSLTEFSLKAFKIKAPLYSIRSGYVQCTIQRLWD